MAVLRTTANEYQRRVCLAMNLISENPGAALSLEEIAEAAGFSMFHFHRIFKAVVGETVAGFTRRLCLEQAANRLAARLNEDITTIALDCGFSSSQNFARAFRRHFGVTPSEYRNSKIGNTPGKTRNALSLQAGYNQGMVTLHPSKTKGRFNMKVEIREMPEFNVAFVRRMGPYGKETCGQAFGELARWAGPRGYMATGRLLGVYWDNPEITPPAKCRVDACVSVPRETVADGQVAMQVIAGGSFAVCHFEMTGDDFHESWEEAFSWLVESGYECDDRPCYELYHNCAQEHPEGKWIFDICIPLKGVR